jgi:hypothetical protein
MSQNSLLDLTAKVASPVERKLSLDCLGEKVVIEGLDLKNKPETAVVTRIDGETKRNSGDLCLTT